MGRWRVRQVLLCTANACARATTCSAERPCPQPVRAHFARVPFYVTLRRQTVHTTPRPQSRIATCKDKSCIIKDVRCIIVYSMHHFTCRSASSWQRRSWLCWRRRRSCWPRSRPWRCSRRRWVGYTGDGGWQGRGGPDRVACRGHSGEGEKLPGAFTDTQRVWLRQFVHSRPHVPTGPTSYQFPVPWAQWRPLPTADTCPA